MDGIDIFEEFLKKFNDVYLNFIRLNMCDLSKNEKGYLLDLLKSGMRFDGRNLLDHRSITINFGYKLGTVELSLGQTRVYSSVTAKLEEPRIDRPNEGFLKFDIDLH